MDETMRGQGVLLLGLMILLPGCATPDATHEWNGTPMAAYLWRHPYPDLVVEVDHVSTITPSAFALDALISALKNVTGKRSVTLLPFEEIPPFNPSLLSPKEWTAEELQEVAREHLDSAEPGEYGRGEKAVLHILFLDGHYTSEEGAAVGLAVSETVFVFSDRPRGEAAPAPATMPRDYTHRTVLIHEAGHVIGLVNRGLPMQRDHEDPQSPHHSRNPGSVMKAGVDLFQSQLATAFPQEAPPFEFDADDLADIAAFQALEPESSR